MRKRTIWWKRRDISGKLMGGGKTGGPGGGAQAGGEVGERGSTTTWFSGEKRLCEKYGN